MADMPPPPPEASVHEQGQLFLEKENWASSPPAPRSLSGSTCGSQKIRKPPTVTPKRFTKFFQPRSTFSTRGGRTSKAGRQLRDITKDGMNRRASGIVITGDFITQDEADFASTRPLKRRRHSFDLSSSPPQSSPLRHGQMPEPIEMLEDDLSDVESLPALLAQCAPFPQPIRRLREPGPSRRILERSFGGYEALSRGFRGADHAADWRSDTANFVTTPNDRHVFRGAALPFCTTSCNTNSLVAVGDEEGRVHLMDSASTSDFSKAHVKFRAHHNAVMDIAFSSDDYSLATASGDQTARVTDMQTQQTMCILSGHKSSVKQVRFHPSDNNMVTTSARDGCVQLWDLRCGSKSAVQNFRASIKGRAGDGTEPETRFGRCLGVGYGHRSGRRPYGSDNRSELSITSFQHLLNGREHMIVTSSEVDASVKLWDLRNAGRRNPVPLASTPLPESHGNKRNFGINAMVLSGDGSRLYTVCRDAAVYAYSTNQLVLGHAPEMSSAPSRRRMLKQPMAGLGPLYAFKNPQLRLATFFVRASMRPAKGDKCEMLAVGSSNYGPILFPTDERHVPRPERPSQQENDPDEDGDEDMGLPSAAPVKTATKKTMQTGTQVFEHGTALVGAHDKEVTSLAWTMDGALVSVSDDFSARCWREEADQARSLRTAGDFGGGRWRSGWAAVDAAWDEDDC